MDDTKKQLVGQMPGWSFFSFDYSQQNTQWAASDQVSGCLAKYLLEVSNKHRAAGGDGLVYVVAHSMGGLAVRFAIGRYPSELGGRVGGVTTLGTPHTGSPWSGGYALTLETLKGLAFRSMPAGVARARDCLAKHAGPKNPGLPAGCEAAPYLPVQVPITEIAGNLTVQRTFFDVKMYDLPMGGDSIVSLDSAQGYLGSVPGNVPKGQKVTPRQINCTQDMESWVTLARVASAVNKGPLGPPLELLSGLRTDSRGLDAVLDGRASPDLVEQIAQAAFFNKHGCSHNGLPTNPTALGMVKQALTDQAKSSSSTLVNFDLSTWRVGPGFIGPYVIGMDAKTAIERGIIRRVTADQCGVQYLVSTRVSAVLGDSLGMDWRFGQSPDKLDQVLTSDRRLVTERGIRIGSTRKQVLAAYKDAMPYREPWNEDRWDNLVLFGPSRHALIIDFDGPSDQAKVSSFTATTGSRETEIAPWFMEC